MPRKLRFLRFGKFPLGLFLAVCLGVQPSATAQLAEQVTDLLAQRDPNEATGTGPYFQVGDRVVFFADSPSTGLELWTTDGTDTGTSLLVDSCPGVCESDRRVVAHLGDELYWLSHWQRRFSNESVLWRTDGTHSGTFPILAPMRARFNQVPPLASIGRITLFSQRSEEGLWSLWRTNGRPGGTFQISNLGAVFNADQPESFHTLGERIYFFYSGVLWSSDGTPEGTLQEFSPDAFTSLQEPLWQASGRLLFTGVRIDQKTLWSFDPASQSLTAIRTADDKLGESLACGGTTDSDPDHVYFYASDSNLVTQLWRTDGSPDTVQQLTDLSSPNPLGSCPSSQTFQVFGNTILFRAGQQTSPTLHRIDADSGTIQEVVQACQPNTQCSLTGLMTRVGENAVFSGWSPEAGQELWVTDGTTSGTQLLKDLCPGPCGSSPQLPLQLDSEVVFLAEGAQGNTELWRTDVTEAGTEKIATFPSTFLIDRRELPSVASSGTHYLLEGRDDAHGTEPWVADGSPEGPKILLDIDARYRSSTPIDLRAIAGGLAFSASWAAEPDGTEVEELWFAPSSSRDVIRFTDFNDFRSVKEMSEAAGRLYFLRNTSGSATELWSSDGTENGTLPIHTLEAPPPTFLREEFPVIELRGSGLFLVNHPDSGGLWRTDGTAVGTVLAVSLAELGLDRGRPLGKAGDMLYFSGLTRPSDQSLFVTDGTAAGTRFLTSVNPFAAPSGFVPLHGDTFFLERECSAGGRLMRSDGTLAGTRPVSDQPRFGCYTFNGEMAATETHLFFIEDEVDEAGERTGLFLWKSDGGPAGAQPLREFPIPGTFPDDYYLTATNFGVFFTPNDEAVGKELWRSDGTAPGTRLVRDIRPGPTTAAIHDLTLAGEQLFFVANDGVHGSELWVTDGNEAGTRLVHDILPGARSSDPRDLTVSGNKLYFSADDGLSGRELWVLPLDDSGPPCRASNTALCLQDGRFKVEMQWTDFQDRTGAGQAVSITEDTGYFWFFSDQNVETILKVLDGTPLNDHFWTFYGALSNVEYWITVTDAETGLTRRYFNPLRNFASVGDNESFGPRGASFLHAPESLESTAAAQPIVVDSQTSEEALGLCTPSARRLCLNGGRFAVEATWADFSGNTGDGQAVTLTDDTGYFWFFSDTNVETVLKVLDGRPNNGAFWVFYGSLSNVDFDLTVTDTQTGAVRTYQNRNRQFASVGDTGAFPQ
ncbi:MAG: hypothetical protein K0U98_15675 [Deltaproteobacteria bacterium]|nr:hypothetical protein [Deltaproteobacteria bacterium]